MIRVTERSRVTALLERVWACFADLEEPYPDWHPDGLPRPG